MCARDPRGPGLCVTRAPVHLLKINAIRSSVRNLTIAHRAMSLDGHGAIVVRHTHTKCGIKEGSQSEGTGKRASAKAYQKPSTSKVMGGDHENNPDAQFKEKPGSLRHKGNNLPTNPSIYSVAKITNLVKAYENIKTSPFNLTLDTDNTTLDVISLEKLKNISKKLRAGKYTFPPVRRVNIPKNETKNETLPLGVASSTEKIIQEAIRLELERVFEPTFLDSSHGFRPKRG